MINIRLALSVVVVLLAGLSLSIGSYFAFRTVDQKPDDSPWLLAPDFMPAFLGGIGIIGAISVVVVVLWLIQKRMESKEDIGETNKK